ncbi:MAG: hypothetical protein EBU46_06070 [Nitrosomonadaceae bacterium]|nr:hypothetical protein [Nitrosomonadaceae bacterium]
MVLEPAAMLTKKEQFEILTKAGEFILNGNSDDPAKVQGWRDDLERKFSAKYVHYAADLLDCLNDVEMLELREAAEQRARKILAKLQTAN